MQMWQHILRCAASYAEKLKPRDAVVSWQIDVMRSGEFWSFGGKVFWMTLQMRAVGQDPTFPSVPPHGLRITLASLNVHSLY